MFLMTSYANHQYEMLLLSSDIKTNSLQFKDICNPGVSNADVVTTTVDRCVKLMLISGE